MQHDRVTSEHINITLEKSKSKELLVEMEVALEEEVALVDVIGRRDGAWLTALWTAWDTAETIDLDISSDMFVSFPCLKLRSSCDLSHELAPIMYLAKS